MYLEYIYKSWTVIWLRRIFFCNNLNKSSLIMIMSQLKTLWLFYCRNPNLTTKQPKICSETGCCPFKDLNELIQQILNILYNFIVFYYRTGNIHVCLHLILFLAYCQAQLKLPAPAGLIGLNLNSSNNPPTTHPPPEATQMLVVTQLMGS